MRIKKIVKEVKKISDDFTILDISLCYPYTYSLLEKDGKRSLGLAMLLVEELKHIKEPIEFKDLDDLIEMSNSLNIIERTLGISTINAICQYYIEVSEEDFKRDILEIAKQYKNIGMIGYIKPIYEKLKEKCVVFDRKFRNDEVVSDAFEYNLIPKFDLLIISGTTLINDTIDMILDRAKGETILVGPTAQLLPNMIDVDYLASVKVPEEAIKYLKLGSNYGIFRLGRKYVIKC
ncbi:protein of unknown function DUF364 [Methanocaldococcus infernus ME]|uniref:Heavy-metal chelation domain-containing protein n=1 Tax=Methanocaldococcus infernus (strain DSM 11812 / JCM 15783 / ME) TaxID=573063 RepID=D5VR29_METIM|nr:DUF364 domain-containing protein [Methanocaldococcus infernus]ADG13032.1 protein of unknown function DUF364 [Methanocaldococcus infernus ME]